MNVPVGSTTKASWGAAATAFVGAIVAYLTGDHTAQSVTAVELAGGALLLLLFTHGFRYAQALVGLKLPGAVNNIVGGIEDIPLGPAGLGATGKLPESNEEQVAASRARGEQPPPGVVADGGDGSQV